MFSWCRQDNFYEVVELEDSMELAIIKKNLCLKIGDDQEYFHDGYAVKSSNAIKISSYPMQCNRFTFDTDQAKEEGNIELGFLANRVEVINASVYLPGAHICMIFRTVKGLFSTNKSINS